MVDYQKEMSSAFQMSQQQEQQRKATDAPEQLTRGNDRSNYSRGRGNRGTPRGSYRGRDSANENGDQYENYRPYRGRGGYRRDGDAEDGYQSRPRGTRGNRGDRGGYVSRGGPRGGRGRPNNEPYHQPQYFSEESDDNNEFTKFELSFMERMVATHGTKLKGLVSVSTSLDF